MRSTAVRQSSSSLRLWCLSRIHSMIQNILKYRTVIIALLNTHPHVLKIYILIFFSLVGGLVCLGGKTVESVLSLSLSSDTGGLLSTLAFFSLH